MSETADGGFIEPRAGTQIIWNSAGDTSVAGLGSIGGDMAGPEGVRGRVDLGLKMGALVLLGRSRTGTQGLNGR